MKIIILSVLLIMIVTFIYAFINKDQSIDVKSNSFSIYDYSAIGINGEEIGISEFKGKKIIIVNVASKCGYTPQYEGLQKLYEKYKDRLVVLGFPSNDFLWQEPGKNSEIMKFCSTKYGVDFPMFEKIIVKKKKKQHPLYTWLSHQKLNGWNDKAPSWNFCKYLIDENGNLRGFYPSSTKPFSDEILSFIEDDE